MTTIKLTSASSALQLIPQAQYKQIEQELQIGLHQQINSASIEKDQEIEAPAHYTAGRTIQPIEVLEDVRFRRLYEIV